jgi:hypothetical protein
MPARNPIRVLRIRKQMFPEFGKTDAHVNGNAVANDMQIGRPEIDNTFADAVLNVRVSNVPFGWNSPIKDLQARGHFADGERYVVPYPIERFSNSVASNASTDRVKF